jgi:hypothetical protein
MDSISYVYQPNISLVLPLQHRTFYSLKDGSSQITNQTILSSTTTKTHTVLQRLYALPNTYYERMEAKNYDYLPNISLVLAITWEII